MSKLEITQRVIGEVAEVKTLTLAQLSWLLWGRRGDPVYECAFHHRPDTERLCQVDPDVRAHLESAPRLVPYRDWTGGNLTGANTRPIGLLGATIKIDVKIRNTGTEPSGIRLQERGQSILRPKALAEVDRWVTYSLRGLDVQRREVVPGSPVVEASLHLVAG